MSSDKRITVRIVRTRLGGHVVVANARETADTVNKRHTLQDAVQQFYALPGECHAVWLTRDGARVVMLWWDYDDRGHSWWRQDWSDVIHDGDVVEICIFQDENQQPPTGPAQRAANVLRRELVDKWLHKSPDGRGERESVVHQDMRMEQMVNMRGLLRRMQEL